MLQVWGTPVLDDTPIARIEGLSRDTLLAIWDDGQEAAGSAFRPMLDGQLAPRPYLVLSVPRRAGGSRHVALLRCSGTAAGRFTAEAGGQVLAAGQRQTEPAPLDGGALMAGLDPAARRKLARGLLAHLAGIGSRAPDAAQASAALIAALWPERPALRPVAAVSGKHNLLEGRLAARIGTVVEAFMLSPRGLKSARAALAVAQDSGGEQPRTRAILPASQPGAGETREAVFIGSNGMVACKAQSASGRLPPLLAWVERAKGKPARRVQELLPMLRGLCDGAPDVAATLRELQILTGRPVERAGIDAPSLQARVETAVADGGGLFVAGWIDDPQQLVAGLAFERDGDTPRAFAERFFRFPRRIRVAADRETAEAGAISEKQVQGFVGYLPDLPEAQQLLGHRFQLLLQSGATIPLAAPAQAADATAARAAVLSALKPEAVTPEILAACLSPAVGALHRRCLTTARTPEIVDLGDAPAQPDISVIIPLYRNLEFLKFQVAAFAVDPDRRRTEYLYVLDSPEQRAEVEHLLRGLWRLHDLPVRLLVNPANLGYAAANNIAAVEARGEVLALVNSDVLPTAPGWAARLAAALTAHPRIGAVGPKLLFEDESLQHAGMYFAPDPSGRWLNHHFHKGMPRFYAPAQIERSVPALTGACLVVRRQDFTAIGGFTEDYVIGDYEDSDLCLKLRREGYDMRYVPGVELYHLERRSIRQHAGYMKGVACLYNSWLHSQRWRAEMMRLSGAETAIVRAGIDASPDVLEPIELPRNVDIVAA
jgi:GT2 family glycosyltransferase